MSTQTLDIDALEGRELAIWNAALDAAAKRAWNERERGEEAYELEYDTYDQGRGDAADLIYDEILSLKLEASHE